MTLLSLLSETVTLVVPLDDTDAYGAHWWNYPAGTRVDVLAWVEKAGTSEDAEGRDQAVDRVRVWLPSGTAVAAHDRIETAAGETYEVEGPSETHYNPRVGRHSHTVAEAVRVRG